MSENQSNLSSSPERDMYMINVYKKKLENATGEDSKKFNQQIEFYEEWKKITMEKESNPTFKENNLEYDLRTTEWILQKARSNETYAQNIYAALCNNVFIKDGKEWSCSWRYAGGIVANMRLQGDYIDWYCSGMEGKVTEEVREDLLKIGWSVQDEMGSKDTL